MLKLDTRGGAKTTLGRRTMGRGATRTVLVCPMADWTAEVILGWREARILAIKSDWEVLVLLDAETPLETAWSSTPARGPSQPTGTFLISTAPFCSLVSCLKPSGPGLVVDGDQGSSRVDVVVGPGHSITIPEQKSGAFLMPLLPGLGVFDTPSDSIQCLNFAKK